MNRRLRRNETTGIRRAPVYLFLVFLISAGCATQRVGMEEQREAVGFQEVLVERMAYDDRGLPVINESLSRRPSRAGDHFTVVHLSHGRPAVSYDIAVIERKADFGKPLKAVYEWTGKGFALGADVSSKLADGVSRNPPKKNEAFAALVLIVTPLVAGAAGGFVVGIGDGIRQTAQELAKVVVNAKEQVVAYTAYAYDASDRLVLMRMYAADTGQELVRTEFSYGPGARVPSRTTVTSVPEGAVRVLE